MLIMCAEKLYIQLEGDERARFVGMLVPLISLAKRTNATRQITALERVIFGPGCGSMAGIGGHHHTHVMHGVQVPDSMAASSAHSLVVDVNSAAPTPSLTNSPQSSSPTSLGATADGVNEGLAEKLAQTHLHLSGPEVQVEEM